MEYIQFTRHLRGPREGLRWARRVIHLPSCFQLCFCIDTTYLPCVFSDMGLCLIRYLFGVLSVVKRLGAPKVWKMPAIVANVENQGTVWIIIEKTSRVQVSKNEQTGREETQVVSLAVEFLRTSVPSFSKNLEDALCQFSGDTYSVITFEPPHNLRFWISKQLKSVIEVCRICNVLHWGGCEI